MYVEKVKRNMRRYVKHQYTPGGSRGCSKETDQNLLFQTSDSTTSLEQTIPQCLYYGVTTHLAQRGKK